jgi:hypothetical protein
MLKSNSILITDNNEHIYGYFEGTFTIIMNKISKNISIVTVLRIQLYCTFKCMFEHGDEIF